MRPRSRGAAIPLIFLFLLTFGSMGALGDGVVINYETVDLLKEENQITIIHHEDGLQRMVVSIQTEGVGTSRSDWKRSLAYRFSFLVLHSLSIIMFVELYFYFKF